jgi:patatin-like phospholipase/acyl hydrolase
LIDGGVFVNNPSMCAYAEVREKYVFTSKNLIEEKNNHPEGSKITAKDMVILSLGTGYAKQEYEYNSAKDWGLVEWVKPLIDIMMAGVSDVVDYQLMQMFKAVDCPEQYLRINSALPNDVSQEMDNASPENLQALKEFGNDVALKFENEINRFLNYL